MSVSEPIVQSLKHSLYLEKCRTFVDLLFEPEFTLTKLSESSSSPIGSVAIKVHKEGERDVTMYFDLQTGLLAGLDEPDKMGGTDQEITRFDHYSNYLGLMWPTITKETSAEGTTSYTSTLESIAPLNQSSGNVFNAPAPPRSTTPTTYTAPMTYTTPTTINKTAPAKYTTPTTIKYSINDIIKKITR